MAKRRANGEGKLRKRDGRWEGRYTTEHAPGTDKAIYVLITYHQVRLYLL